MFRIGDFSRLTQVTVKALRHYDHLGLLTPALVDQETGYRYYSAAQASRLNRILALKDLGLALDQIGQFLDADLSLEQLRALLLIKQGETRRHLEEENARLARIDARLRQIDGQAGPTYDVVLKRSEAVRVASLRTILPNHGAIRTLFAPLGAFQARHGLRATDWTVIWHDPDFRDSSVDAEATFATEDALPPHSDIRARALPAVDTMACIVYQGPPDRTGRACMALLTWIEANDNRIAGPERVRALERGGRDGQESVTELQWPVERDKAVSGSDNDA
ncbi:MAG: MerR family transcriptional regulator [Chloroflexota bacterium]